MADQFSVGNEPKRNYRSPGTVHREAPDPLIDVAPWPELQSPALHGVAGEIAKVATEHSEVDPVAIVATTLTYAAAMFGRNRFMSVGDTDHHARLFSALVGHSSRARKGTSFDPVRKIFTRAEDVLQSRSTLPFPSGLRLKVVHGLSSGEGLIDIIRDKRGEDDDGGVLDKRVLCIEGEFASVLKVCQRQGNTLGTTLRTAWDGWKLEPLTKNEKISSTESHICLLAHITGHELREMLSSSDSHNGFANRFCWFAVRRQKSVPFPRPMREDTVSALGRQVADVIQFAHGQSGSSAQLKMSNAAADHWANVYAELTEDYPGLLGAVTSRAEAQVLRVAMTYAQLDGADRVEFDHVEAALALWRYSFDSAAHIFGGAEFDPTAQRIVEFLIDADRAQNEIVNLFSRNVKKQKLDQVLGDLQSRGRITLKKDMGTGGRPKLVWSLNM